MRIGIPKETRPEESRVALSPEVVAKYVKKGAEVLIEAGLGESCHWSDAEFTDKGAKIAGSREELLKSAELVLRVSKPEMDELDSLSSGCIHISYLDPFNERELVRKLQSKGISAISMEMVPRTTRAQKMDALSSQHSLAGYYMVILAAERLDSILPMMMTPSCTIQPARVFIIGAGVAGLQAIATAKRLGARVDAFDTRPVVEEQVKSLGGRFVKVDLGETGESSEGYAKELTDEQKALQQEAMASYCANADIVITTAALFGRKAPIVIKKDVIERMKPGSVIVDYAVATGGNVEGSKPGEEVIVNGVRIIGLNNYPGQICVDASRMYANNLYNMVDEFWDDEKKTFHLNREDEIIQGCLITHAGELVNETIRDIYAKEAKEEVAD